MKNKLMIATALGSMTVFCACNPQPETKVEVTVNEVADPTLTVAEINAAQQAWCDALVEIGRLHSTGGDYKAFAEQVLTEAYDYDEGRVFFKPTLTTGDQVFRKTKKGALAYFVGGDPEYPNDNGFALKPWVEVRYDNDERGAEEVMILGNIGIAMGSVYFKDKDGNEIFVDKTFVFKKGDDGKVRLILHKSALPVM
jgi:hypothetical protein